MKLNFTVNSYYLASLALTVDEKLASKEWLRFRDEVLLAQYSTEWDKVKQKCYCKDRSPRFNLLLEIHNEVELSKVGLKSAIPLFKSIFEFGEFKRLYDETVKYKDLVEAEWKQNESIITRNAEEIMGFKFAGKNVEVSIGHPSVLSTGFSRIAKHGHFSKNYIAWGHEHGLDKENYPNYNSIYLAHEMLHIEFNWSNRRDEEISHSLIELLADNELRLRLNGEGKYFEEKWQRHQYLRHYERSIYPYWVLFANRNSSNLKEQVKNAFERDGYNGNVERSVELAKIYDIKTMNIVNFEHFVNLFKCKHNESIQHGDDKEFILTR